MNTLYFVKLTDRDWNNVVFLITASEESEAATKGLEGIADQYRAEYAVKEVTPVCQTPDSIERFEPC